MSGPGRRLLDAVGGEQPDQRVEQLRLAQRFGEEGREQPRAALDVALAERAEQDHRQAGPDRADAPRKRHAVHAGHVHVEDGEVEGRPCERPQRRLGRSKAAVSASPLAGLERQDLAVGRVVVHDQQALACDLGLPPRQTARLRAGGSQARRGS